MRKSPNFSHEGIESARCACTAEGEIGNVLQLVVGEEGQEGEELSEKIAKALLRNRFIRLVLSCQAGVGFHHGDGCGQGKTCVYVYLCTMFKLNQLYVFTNLVVAPRFTIQEAYGFVDDALRA